MAAQMAAMAGGKLGLGGYYFLDDGLGWEDLSPASYSPSDFRPTRSGFLTIDGSGSWNVVSFADRGSYRFLCKIPAADTTTFLPSTTVPSTTVTSTHVATTATTAVVTTAAPVIDNTTITTTVAATNASTTIFDRISAELLAIMERKGYASLGDFQGTLKVL